MNFLHRTPFLRLLLPLLIGIIFYQYVDLSEWSFLSLLMLSLCVIYLSFKIKIPDIQYKFRWLYGCGIFLFIFVLGYSVSSIYEKNHSFQNLEKTGIFRIELLENPVEKENSVLCRIKTLQYLNKSQFETTKGKALIYIQKDEKSVQLQSGDILLVRAEFKRPDAVLNPNGFDYRTYLKRQGFGATDYISADNWRKSGIDEKFSLFRLAEQTQTKLLSIYKRFGIRGDEYAVLAALTLGSKDALHPELRQNYTTSGGMHILAVSGLHVGIIYLVLGFLFSFFNRNPKLKLLKSLLIVILLWSYAFITGLPPSVIRSTIMFSMIAIGSGMERKSQIYNTIFTSAFLMLLFNPNFLFDVGFQLSYSAVISIVYFQPIISKWFTIKSKAVRWAWELTAVSLAAQIGTAPFALYYFHQFSNYFFITNFVAIPFASFIIYTAVALIIVSPVPYVSVAIAFILQWLLKILNFCIFSIHNLPHSLTVTTINSWQVMLIFGVILMMAFYFQTKKFSFLFSSLVMVLMVEIINLTIIFNTINKRQLIVYADNTNTHIDFIEGKNHSVFTTDSAGIIKIAQSFWLNNKMNSPEKICLQNRYTNGFVSFHGKRILILTDSMLRNKITSQKLNIDFLIVGNNQKPKIKQILECVSPGKVIVDKSISKWYTESIKQDCKRKNIEFYSVAEKGAFILNITD